MKSKKRSLVLTALFAAGTVTAAPAPSFASPTSKGVVTVDGSSTVFPISEAVAEEFQRTHKGTGVTVGVSGTGGGFKKFVAGEVDIVDASRPIKATEMELAAKNGVTFIELPVAYDALSVVVNPKNSWATSLTTAELKKIWSPEAQGKITKWSDVRAGFPDKPLQLFGPGTDSGTFDYFTEVINGKEDASRGDYTSSEDDNVIVTGVSGNEGALGFFGVAFYEANKNRLKVVPIDDEKPENGAGPQEPTATHVIDGSYSPLSRPLFIYVRTEALARPEVAQFVSFYLEQVKSLASEVGYVSLPDEVLTKVQSRFASKVVGSLYDGKPQKPGTSLAQLLH
ncbi:MAG: phosphate transport system substrate-binding protein [Pseudomonadota bacterium]|jgi:phosphate transport system substrate-binding protein